MSDRVHSLDVVDNPAAERFEATIDGQIAELQYMREGDRLILAHTEVPAALEGRGIGSALVKAVLDRVRAEHREVTVFCPFVREYIERHPEYQDLIAGNA